MKKKNEKLKARVEALENRVRTLEAMFNSLSAVSALSADAGQKLLIVNSPSPKGSLPSRAACAGSTLPSEQCFATACPPGQKAHPCGLNEKAWELMEKARKGGLLDEEYRPTGSRTEAALLAGAIAYEVNISKKWKVFESLWSMKRLDQAYFRAQYHPKSAEIMKTINNVLDSSFEMD